MKIEMTKEQIQNTITLLERVDLKGNEAFVMVDIMGMLQEALKNNKDEAIVVK